MGQSNTARPLTHNYLANARNHLLDHLQTSTKFQSQESFHHTIRVDAPSENTPRLTPASFNHLKDEYLLSILSQFHGNPKSALSASP
ncbi:hypothetical protein EMCRGX_G032911 [Ephydatia muelleri]